MPPAPLPCVYICLYGCTVSTQPAMLSSRRCHIHHTTIVVFQFYLSMPDSRSIAPPPRPLSLALSGSIAGVGGGAAKKGEVSQRAQQAALGLVVGAAAGGGGGGGCRAVVWVDIESCCVCG